MVRDYLDETRSWRRNENLLCPMPTVQDSLRQCDRRWRKYYKMAAIMPMARMARMARPSVLPALTWTILDRHHSALLNNAFEDNTAFQHCFKFQVYLKCFNKVEVCWKSGWFTTFRNGFSWESSDVGTHGSHGSHGSGWVSVRWSHSAHFDEQIVIEKISSHDLHLSSAPLRGVQQMFTGREQNQGHSPFAVNTPAALTLLEGPVLFCCRRSLYISNLRSIRLYE